MADYYGSLADFADFARYVEEITLDEAYRDTPPLCPLLRDRQNPIDAYNDAEFLSRYRFFQASGASHVGNAAPMPKGQRRGHPVPPLQADDMRQIVLTVLRHPQNPIEAYSDAGSLSRYRLSKRAVLRLLEMLPLGPNDDERG
ncbi:hypothetical protein HPB52_015441 [Rhipicephalus sanguineus]|uniref:Uncharacterized protein n=1 Tax=Rhipicephalus sanguineus TaxID=34632 RepID=A0A9D4TAK7_RHISA|nr:hypothetical protein HPB52_015441 [Rhipicephalus sanguineus]